VEDIMQQRTVTFSLKGHISVETYARALEHFAALIYALTEEIAANQNISWRVERLEAGSATITVGAVVENDLTAQDVERIVYGYATVARYLHDNQPIPYSADVVEHATALTEFIDTDVSAVEFAGTDFIWTIADARTEPTELRERRQRAWGTVTGVIKTISLRRGLSVRLYDTLFDRSVECHFASDHQELIRNAWGKLVTVTGRIERDPDTGRPVRIYDIRAITTVETIIPGQYKQTRGILPWPDLEERPEDVVRRLRDVQ
jgi:hypothetical protein